MRFVHIADCHLGAWRHPAMRDANSRAFAYVIEWCLDNKVDFLLIAGDFFNTAHPSIESLHAAVAQLMRLRREGIPVYLIPGSHDFSPSGRTMLDVLERTGLFINVMHHATVDGDRINLKLVRDEKTGAQITGMYGRRGALDKFLYEYINRDELEQAQGYKIFMFHCAVSELKPAELSTVDAVPVSLLPQNFSYYAGGHVHIRESRSIPSYPNLVYPGPVFPNSFGELEKLGGGSFVVVEDGRPRHCTIPLHRVIPVGVDATGKSYEEIDKELRSQLPDDVDNGVILLRLSGKLTHARMHELGFTQLTQELHRKGAVAVLKNTGALEAVTQRDVRIKGGSAEEIELGLIQEIAGKQEWISREREVELMHSLVTALADEQNESETQFDYEARIARGTEEILKRT